MATFEVVEGHRQVSGTRQRLAGMASDKSGTAGYEDGLHGSNGLSQLMVRHNPAL